MATIDYEKLLTTSWDAIPKVKLLPPGTYRMRARGASFQKPRSEEGSAQVLFIHTPMEPMDNVDESALAELGAGYDIENNRIFTRFYVENGADLDRVRKLIEMHGVDTAGMEGDAPLKAVKGHDILATLGIKTFRNAMGQNEPDNVVVGWNAIGDNE